MLRINILILAVLLPVFLSAQERYYYHYDQKIYMSEIKGDFTFIPSPQLKNANAQNISAILAKAYSQEGNTYFFNNLTPADTAALKSSGTLFNAYSRGKYYAKLFVNNNLFVKLPTSVKKADTAKWFKDNGLVMVDYYPSINWFVASTTGNTIDISRDLREKNRVTQAEPSFYLPLSLKAYIPNDPFFGNQWHIRNELGTAGGLSGNDHAHIAEAWELLTRTGKSPGSGVFLSIIDDGFDLNHEDFAGRFFNSKDFGSGANQQMYNSQQDAHGTCCAGVAAANYNNNIGVAGACPECTVIPVRVGLSGTGSLDQIAIQSFQYVFDAGAEILSCSWGPADGGGAMDMGAPLKELIQKMTTEGRGGKGMIILFAAGNGNESIDSPQTFDGYAANPNVFAIGATNAAGKRASYSDFGGVLDFMAPSCDMKGGGDGWGSGGQTIDGIWSTDNSVGGYNPGQMTGDSAGKYAGQFGGTSSAAPLAAGITGLVLAANPDLTKDEIYEIYKQTSDKVSKGAVNAGETDYDNNGFSLHYGYGRLNACEAVKAAILKRGGSIPDNPCNPDPVNTEPSDNDNSTDENSVSDDNAKDDTVADNNTKTDDQAVNQDNTQTQSDADNKTSRAAKSSGCGCAVIY